MNIQYVSAVTADKNRALLLKCQVRKNKFLFLKKDCSWDELKTLIQKGCTIARVGTKSEYIALDFDDTEVTHAEMKSWAENYGPDVLWTKSISGKEFKHHLYFKVDEYDASEIKEKTSACFKMVANAFPGKKLILDKNAWSYWQCMYNVGKEDCCFVLDGSIQLNDWCCKMQVPVPYIDSDVDEDAVDEEEYDDALESYLLNGAKAMIIPNSAKWYLESLIASGGKPSLYKSLPFETLSNCYVKKGNRHASSYKVVNVLVKNFIIINTLLIKNAFSMDDVMYTIEKHMQYHFEDGEKYFAEDKASIENAVKTIFNDFIHSINESGAATDYEALIDVFGKGNHRLGIDSFAKKFMEHHERKSIERSIIDIMETFYTYEELEDADAYDAIYSKIKNAIKPYFEKANTLTISKDLNEAKRIYEMTKDVKLFDGIAIEPMSFEEFSSKGTAGDDITFRKEDVTISRKARTDKNKQHKQHKQHSNKGKCIKDFSIDGDTVFVPKDRISSSIRKYCSIHKIKIKIV